MLYLQWTIYKHVLLSVDIEKNPGPDRETLKFCSWNLNSINAHEYIRVSLLEAYNSLYKYDLIGIVETHLDNTVDEGNLTLRGYNLTKSNHPGNLKEGGVGLYVKESFPAKNRVDLVTLPECIVSEIQLDGKKYFFAVLYRSPSQTAAEFEIFIKKFDVMLSRMSAENPYAVIITGDFNCRSPQWWENDNENEEGKIFEPHTSELGLHQLISEATHIMGDSKSCIDLIFTDQPNLFLESGVHPSLHEQCHHQIVYGELSVKNLAPPPYYRKVWFYDRANVYAIRKCIQNFRWRDNIQNLTCPNQQVELLTELS